MVDTIEDLEKRLAELGESTEKVDAYIHKMENALIHGEGGTELVVAIGESYRSLESIAFERGKVEAYLELARDEGREEAAASKEQRIDADLRRGGMQISDGHDWVEQLAAKNDRSGVAQEPEKESERAAAAAEIEWWEVEDPQERAVAEQKYREWEKSREDPNHVDDLDEPTPTRPR